MIKHTKFAKSNIPSIPKQKRKKTIKKIVSSCGTPRKIFSKSTSRNGSPFPVPLKQSKKGQVPKIKTSASTTRVKFDALHSYASPINSSSNFKKVLKFKKTKALSNNLSPKDRERSNMMVGQFFKESYEPQDKMPKLKAEESTVSQLKLLLQKVLMENSMLRNKSKYLAESQEEPKMIMNSNSVESAIEELKMKLRNLKLKFS